MVKLKTLSYSLIYFTLMVVNYVNYIAPIFGYAGFAADFQWDKLILAVLILVTFVLLTKSSGIIGFYHTILVTIVLIPSLSLYSAGVVHDEYALITSFACFVVILVSTLLRVPSPKTLSLGTDSTLKLFLIISSLMVVAIAMINGVGSLNFNLMKVYQFRDEFSENLPPVFNYFFPIIGKIILPIMIVISVIQKRYFYLFSGIALSVLIFAYTAHKSPLFYPFIILGVYYISGRNWNKLIYLALIGVTVVAMADFYLSEEYKAPFGLFGSIFSRRAIYVPVLLNNAFIDFFSQNPMLYWSESKLTFGLTSSPYSQPSVFVIGARYFGDPTLAANTGFIGSGYANAGWFGVFIYSFVIGVLISYFDRVAKHVGQRFITSATFVIMFVVITSADFVTSLLTHGLVALLFILLILPRKQLT